MVVWCGEKLPAGFQTKQAKLRRQLPNGVISLSEITQVQISSNGFDLIKHQSNSNHNFTE